MANVLAHYTSPQQIMASNSYQNGGTLYHFLFVAQYLIPFAVLIPELGIFIQGSNSRSNDPYGQLMLFYTELQTHLLGLSS